jgi:iron complex transport system substrate-binding protein
VKGNGITMAPYRSTRPFLLALAFVMAACAPQGDASTSPSASPPPTEAPSSAPATPVTAFPVTVTDELGHEVTLDAEPARIVSLAPSNTEIVCALGACDRLVGVTDFDDFPAEVVEVPKVVIGAQVDVERVVDAAPDLVLAAGNELTPSSVIEQIDALVIPILVLYPESLDEVYADIELVGRALGASAAAEDVIDGMQERAAAVVEAVAGAERPRTLYEVFHAEGTTYTAGDGSFLASLIDMAGAEPIVGDAQGVIDAEELVTADPEVILLGSASYDPGLASADAALATVAARTGWSGLAAVREGRVIPFLDDIVTTRPGPRIVDGLEALARALHPDRFD